MKIIHIANFGHTGPGGIKTAVENLAKSQQELGAQVYVGLTLRHEICDTDDTFVHCPSLKSFKDLIKTKHPDIVVFHGLFNLSFFSFSQYCRLKRIPYGIVMHGAGTPASMRDRSKKKKLALFLFVNQFVRQASALFFLCDGERQKNVLANKNKNHYIIPNGVDKIHPYEKKRENKRVKFLFLGRIVYYEKAIDILLQVFEILKQQGKETMLEFAFYGPLYSDQLLLDIAPYASFVSWKGPVYGDVKFKVYSDFDIFVLVSRSEGMPMSIIEALSCGTPCLVTEETNLAELISKNDAGWITSLIPNKIADDMIAALEDFSHRPKELYNNSIRSVADYTWPSIGKQSLAYYQEIIDHNL